MSIIRTDWRHGECTETCPYCRLPCVIEAEEIWVSHRCKKGHTW